MLNFRLHYLLESRGVVSPYNFLIRIGFSRNLALRWLSGRVVQFKLSHVGNLCKALQCTPNDLLEWNHGKEENLPEGHPLLSLVRHDIPFNMINHINRLSLEQVKEVRRFIEKINNKETRKENASENKREEEL